MTPSMMKGIEEALRTDGLHHYADQVECAAQALERAEARVAELEACLREVNGQHYRRDTELEMVRRQQQRGRIAELEADNARLREALAACGRAGCPTAAERGTGR